MSEQSPHTESPGQSRPAAPAGPASAAAPAGSASAAGSAAPVPAGGAVYRIAKRLFDIVFSLIAIVIGIVPSLILCIVIRIDSPGSPIYVQDRVKALCDDGTPVVFRMYKFRSMIDGADEYLDNISDLNEADGPLFKIVEDPRVTRVGRFIRRHSIDELPQFLNVLKGDLSIVGPRPPLPRELEYYGEREFGRLAVRPGLTGPWQVSGRSNLGFQQMVDFDLDYIRTRSFSRDLSYVARTVGVMFSGEGAA